MPRASISPASNEEVNSEPMKKEVLSTKMKEFERTDIEAQELDKIGKQIAGDHAKEEIRKQQIENAQSIIASTQAL
jgi:hypothetical protein